MERPKKCRFQNQQSLGKKLYTAYLWDSPPLFSRKLESRSFIITLLPSKAPYFSKASTDDDIRIGVCVDVRFTSKTTDLFISLKWYLQFYAIPSPEACSWAETEPLMQTFLTGKKCGCRKTYSIRHTLKAWNILNTVKKISKWKKGALITSSNKYNSNKLPGSGMKRYAVQWYWRHEKA